FRLLPGTREPVQNETVLRVGLLETLGCHGQDQVVRHQIARVHEPLSLLAELGAVLDCGAQHFARGDVRELEVLTEPLGLRSLPSSRRAEQNQIELRHGGALYRPPPKPTQPKNPRCGVCPFATPGVPPDFAPRMPPAAWLPAVQPLE